MPRLDRLVALTGLLAALAGCASSGRQFDATHVNEIENGKQDKATVLAWFGDADARVRILEPVQTAGMTLEDLPRLKELVRAQIAEALPGLRADLARETNRTLAPSSVARTA